MTEPILAQKTRHTEHSGKTKFVVYGGLHYIKGNSAPYFSLTYWEKTLRGRELGGGAGHDEILAEFPQFADLAALHLSDINGKPVHALENGFYHLGGTHWQAANFAHAAKHFRISEAEAEALAKEIFGAYFSRTTGTTGDREAAKARLAKWVESQKPRWKAEAGACIKKHNLTIYGDKWKTA